MAKKIFYRPSTFKIRDLFDLAAVIDEGYGEELLQAIAVFNDKLVLVRNRIAVLKSIYAERAPMDVNPTEKGLKWLDVDNVIPLVHDFLAGCSLNSVQESKLDLTP